MGWNECDQAIKSGVFFSLEDDGDRDVVIFLAPPDPRMSTYKGQERGQACFPVLTDAGLQVWPVGSRLYRQLKKGWADYSKKAVNVIRHGKKEDTATKYELVVVPAPPSLRKAQKAATKDAIAEAIEAAVTSGTDEQTE